MSSVGRAAQAMIVEVRRQFAEIPGLREGQPELSPTADDASTYPPEAALRKCCCPVP